MTATPDGLSGTPDAPIYAKVVESSGTGRLYRVTVDEGWRSTGVCSGMYGWAADWLVGLMQGRPYAPDTRP